MKPAENLATANDEAQRTTETKLTESLESRLKDRFYGARDESASSRGSHFDLNRRLCNWKRYPETLAEDEDPPHSVCLFLVTETRSVRHVKARKSTEEKSLPAL